MKIRRHDRCNRYCKNKRHRQNLLCFPFTLSFFVGLFCSQRPLPHPPSQPTPPDLRTSKMNVIARQTTNSQRSGHIRHASRSVRQASLRPTIASIAASTANAHPTAPCPLERTSSNFNLTFTSSDIQIECHCTPGNTNGHRTSDRRETFTTIASSAHCHSLRPPSLPAPPHLQTVAATPTATALRPSSRTSQHLRITSARLTPSARSLLPLSPPVSPHLRHSHVIANNSSVCLYT